MNQKFLGIDIWIWQIIKLAIILILLGVLVNKCREDKTNSSINNYVNNQNLLALKDSVRVYRNKAKELTYEKYSLISSNKSLDSLNKELAEELKNARGKVITIIKYKTIYKRDTVYVNNTLTKYLDGKYSLDWKSDSIYSIGNYRTLSGNSFFKLDTLTNTITPLYTRINQDEIGFSMVTGLQEKDSLLEIFVTPKFPNMVVTDIQGTLIDPRESEVIKKFFPAKKWSVGPYFGIGISSNLKKPSQIIPTIGFGVSVQRTLFRF